MRFRPEINSISWYYGDHHVFREVRTEYRRLAHFQIDEIIKSKIAALEQESSQVQLQILSNGFVTDAAKDFFNRLPTVEPYFAGQNRRDRRVIRRTKPVKYRFWLAAISTPNAASCTPGSRQRGRRITPTPIR